MAEIISILTKYKCFINRNGSYNHCYEYIPTDNTWEIAMPMKQKRFLATAVRQDDGKMWVIGGIDPSASKKAVDPSYTEEYTYQRSTRNRNRNLSKWKGGAPIPQDYRDSGVIGHCTVQVNETYIFLSGKDCKNSIWYLNLHLHLNSSIRRFSSSYHQRHRVDNIMRKHTKNEPLLLALPFLLLI